MERNYLVVDGWTRCFPDGLMVPIPDIFYGPFTYKEATTFVSSISDEEEGVRFVVKKFASQDRTA